MAGGGGNEFRLDRGPSGRVHHHPYSRRLDRDGIDVLINGVSIFNITGNGGGNTNWMPQSITFGVNASSTLTFAAIGTSDSLGGYLDNIALDGVPEPAAWALMIAGFGLVGAASRRRVRTAVTYA